jgi:hypothetical protein
MPIRLPTLPGDTIEFVGSIIEAPVLPELFIRREGDWIVVFWNRTPFEFVLETAADPGATSWQPISGPYAESGNFLEHAIPEKRAVQHLVLPPAPLEHRELARRDAIATGEGTVEEPVQEAFECG